MILHAGLAAALSGGRWRGVLITGPSGSGKSDLALRLLDRGFSLVADDRTVVWTSGGVLHGRAPDSLAGLMEARGQGVIRLPHRAFAPISLIVDLAEASIERMPELETREVLGAPIPLLRQLPFEASAPAKIGRWLMGLG